MPGWYCVGSTCSTQCGDGIIAGDEICDDPNCQITCLACETGFIIDHQTSLCVEVCGDGIVAGTEGCDDGTHNDNRGCDSTCSSSLTGFTCVGNAC